MTPRIAIATTCMLAILFFTTVQVSAPMFTSGQHAVIIRIDDIQDYESIPEFTGPEYKILQYNIDQHVPTLVALITSRFGTNAHLIDLVKTGVNQGIFLLGNHGWHHDLYNNQSRNQQTQELGYAENRLQTIFGVHVLTFVPPYGGYNGDTIAAMKSNDMTLISPTSEYAQVMLLEQDGILYLPQTVTTAEVDPGTDSWIPRSLQSVTDQISASWESFGVAVVVLHPRQFVDVNNTWVDARWNIYTQMIDWIKSNQGTLMIPTPPAPPAKPANINPFMISVALFSGLTTSLIVALNVSSKRSKRMGNLQLPRVTSNTSNKNQAPPQPVPSSTSSVAWSLSTIGRLGITRARISTKIVAALGLASSVLLFVMWLTSGKTYLDLGLNWIGIGAFGVGLFQGKIFYSSTISFILTFVIAFCVLVERQKRHPAVSLVVSALVVLSAAYVFEYVYLFLNGQALLKYLTRFNWWFNLLAGLAVGFGFKFMRVSKVSIGLFSMFAISFAVWYLSGYPQLADKETPVLLYTNYTGFPVTWAYPLNAITKLFACLATVSLLFGGILRPQPVTPPTPKIVEAKLPRVPIRERFRPFKDRLWSIADKIPSRALRSCTFCGRQLAFNDRYCDSCGRQMSEAFNIMATART